MPDSNRLAALAKVRRAIAELQGAQKQNLSAWEGMYSILEGWGSCADDIVLLLSAGEMSREEAEAEAGRIWQEIAFLASPEARVSTIATALLDVDRLAELRHAALEAHLNTAITEARNWRVAAEANRDSAMGYQDRALKAECEKKALEKRLAELPGKIAVAKAEDTPLQGPWRVVLGGSVVRHSLVWGDAELFAAHLNNQLRALVAEAASMRPGENIEGLHDRQDAEADAANEHQYHSEAAKPPKGEVKL